MQFVSAWTIWLASCWAYSWGHGLRLIRCLSTPNLVQRFRLSAPFVSIAAVVFLGQISGVLAVEISVLSLVAHPIPDA